MFTSIIFAFATLGHVIAGYSGSSSNSGNDVGQGHSTGTGFGYSGSYSGSIPPNFAGPSFPQFDFSGFLDTLSKYHQQVVNKGDGALTYSLASSSANSHAKAQSSIIYVKGAGLPVNGNSGGIPSATGFGGGFGSSFGGGGSHSGRTDGGAASSASIGPQGIQQTASVFPENPNAPNIFTRFGGAPSQNGNGGGQFSVFTSSSSHSSDANGKPQTFHRAVTTVNDNGKITTYTASNP